MKETHKDNRAYPKCDRVREVGFCEAETEGDADDAEETVSEACSMSTYSI
jgi:hypothetical protein